MKQNETKRLIAAGALICSANLLTISSLTAAVLDFESVPLGAPNGGTGFNNGMSGRGDLTLDGVTFSNSLPDLLRWIHLLERLLIFEPD